MRKKDMDRSPDKQALSLVELNQRIRMTLEQAFPDTYWVRAEMSDVREDGASGHCYLEFIEEDPRSGQRFANVSGALWAQTSRPL